MYWISWNTYRVLCLSLILLSFVFLLSGCDELTFKEPERENKVQEVIPPETIEEQLARFEDRFELTVSPNSMIEYYDVEVRWRPLRKFEEDLEQWVDVNNIGIEIQRSTETFDRPWLLEAGFVLRRDSGPNRVHSPQIAMSWGQYRDTLRHDHTAYYRVILRDRQNLEPLLEFERSIEIPFDFVVDSKLPQNLTKGGRVEAHRVYFERDATLYIGSHNLEFVAQQLIVEDGGRATIASFSSEERIAFPEQDGRDAGSVSIEVTEMIGTLEFDLRGQDGGSGQDGARITPAVAAKGRDAGQGRLRCVSLGVPDMMGLGLPTQESCHCANTGRNAANGENGKNGEHGTAGGRGGDGGALSILISHGKDAVIGNRNLRGGEGGPGGRGSAGQKGGAGGSGRSPGSDECRGLAGQPGRDGARGANGADGEQGVQGRLCLQIKDAPEKAQCGDKV